MVKYAPAVDDEEINVSSCQADLLQHAANHVEYNDLCFRPRGLDGPETERNGQPVAAADTAATAGVCFVARHVLVAAAAVVGIAVTTGMH